MQRITHRQILAVAIVLSSLPLSIGTTFGQQPGLPPPPNAGAPYRPPRDRQLPYPKKHYKVQTGTDKDTGDKLLTLDRMWIEPDGLSFQRVDLLVLSRRPKAATSGRPPVGLLFSFSTYSPFSWNRQTNRRLEFRSGEHVVPIGQLEIVSSTEGTVRGSVTSIDQLGISIAADDFSRMVSDMVVPGSSEVRIGEFRFDLNDELVNGLKLFARELAKE